MSGVVINSESAMLQYGEQLANSIVPGAVVYLVGTLGVGKTTLVKGILRGFGYQGDVTSPTYTLVENYCPGDFNIYHFDLYRMESPDELEMIGIRDMIDCSTVSLIEWPQHGIGILPSPSCEIVIEYLDSARKLEVLWH